MSQRNCSMDDDDIAFAIGRLIIDNGLTNPDDLQQVAKIGLDLRSYSGIHNRLYCVCDVGFGRGYLFLEERKRIRELLDEMDALPDQSDFRVNAPRVPSYTRGIDAVIPEAVKEVDVQPEAAAESFPPIVFSRESA